MDKETLRKVQMVQLQILKEVDRVCRENSINYWLAGGTQLGAVRHKGFIPWDDDLDIAMKRNDYEKFRTIASSLLDEQFYFQDWNNDEGYGLPYGKVRKRNTRYVEEGSRKTKALNGIYIDVFPYDNLPETKIERQKLNRGLWFCLRTILMKKSYTPWLNDNRFSMKRYLAYIPYRIIAFFSSFDKLKKKYLYMSTQYNSIKCGYMYNSGEPLNTEYPMSSAMLDDLILAKFENYEFYIPRRYDNYLKTAYGDYMTLPPEDKRENRHTVIEIVL